MISGSDRRPSKYRIHHAASRRRTRCRLAGVLQFAAEPTAGVRVPRRQQPRRRMRRRRRDPGWPGWSTRPSSAPTRDSRRSTGSAERDEAATGRVATAAWLAPAAWSAPDRLPVPEADDGVGPAGSRRTHRASARRSAAAMPPLRSSSMTFLNTGSISRSAPGIFSVERRCQLTSVPAPVSRSWTVPT